LVPISSATLRQSATFTPITTASGHSTYEQIICTAQNGKIDHLGMCTRCELCAWCWVVFVHKFICGIRWRPNIVDSLAFRI